MPAISQSPALHRWEIQDPSAISRRPTAPVCNPPLFIQAKMCTWHLALGSQRRKVYPFWCWTAQSRESAGKWDCTADGLPVSWRSASDDSIHSITAPDSRVLVAEDEDDLLQSSWARAHLQGRGWEITASSCVSGNEQACIAHAVLPRTPSRILQGKLTAILYGQLCHYGQNSSCCMFECTSSALNGSKHPLHRTLYAFW